MTAQITPVGPTPTIDVTFVGALLWAPNAEAARVLELVRDDDIESVALATVLAAMRRLVAADKPHGPQLVLDELRQVGALRNHNGVADQLQVATTSGAHPQAAWHYAGAVVAGALRRRVESYGVVLTTAARESAENHLASHVEAATRVIGDCIERLNQLRGESSAAACSTIRRFTPPTEMAMV